jgi:hypothetical protein
MMSVFHSYLVQYINIGCFSKVDYILSLINSSKLFSRNALKAIRLYEEVSVKNAESIKRTESPIELKVYNGNNTFVHEMMSRLHSELNIDLFGAYVHGSLATNEEIAYSDFDALVILKDAVFENEARLLNAASKLHSLQQVMHEFDPLQHHGWFVMTESMLQDYPSLYYPVELFQHTRSLLKNQGLNFSVQIKETTHQKFQTPFYHLSNGILNKLKKGYRAKNSFELKSLLSEFMLLPALYLQAKSHMGVYKKDSFPLAEKDFEKEAWEIMNEVSSIRTEWNYQLSPIPKYLLSHRNYTIRKIGRKYAPKILDSISEKLSANFFERMTHLTQQMQSKLKEQNHIE